MNADYHIHTSFSFDSFYDMEEAVKDAIALGLDEICFTDHVDYGIKKDRTGRESEEELIEHKRDYNVDYPAYFAKIEEMQKKYEGQITIRRGLEFGMQVPEIPKFQKLSDTYPMDFILLSIHSFDNHQIYKKDAYLLMDHIPYHRRYYEEMLGCVKNYKDYTVLAHIDNINRYDPRRAVPLDSVRDLLEEILKTVIRDGKGLEVNTATARYGITDMTPSREILRLYKELGGEILSIGSDVHRKGSLGLELDYNREELRKLGFRTFCTFEKQKPVFHEL